MINETTATKKFTIEVENMTGETQEIVLFGNNGQISKNITESGDKIKISCSVDIKEICDVWKSLSTCIEFEASFTNWKEQNLKPLPGDFVPIFRIRAEDANRNFTELVIRTIKIIKNNPFYYFLYDDHEGVFRTDGGTFLYFNLPPKIKAQIEMELQPFKQK